MHLLQNGPFIDCPPRLCTSESGAISIVFEQAIYLFNKWIGAVQRNFLTDIFDLVYSCFA